MSKTYYFLNNIGKYKANDKATGLSDERVDNLLKLKVIAEQVDSKADEKPTTKKA